MPIKNVKMEESKKHHHFLSLKRIKHGWKCNYFIYNSENTDDQGWCWWKLFFHLRHSSSSGVSTGPDSSLSIPTKAWPIWAFGAWWWCDNLMIIIISINYVLTLIIMIPLTTSNSHLLHWSRQNVPLFSLQLFIFDKKHLWQHKVGSALVSASDKEEHLEGWSTLRQTPNI